MARRRFASHLRAEPPSLLPLHDLCVSPALLAVLASWLGGVGLLILPLAVLSYLLILVMIWYVIRHWRVAMLRRSWRDMHVQSADTVTPSGVVGCPKGYCGTVFMNGACVPNLNKSSYNRA